MNRVLVLKEDKVGSFISALSGISVVVLHIVVDSDDIIYRYRTFKTRLKIQVPHRYSIDWVFTNETRVEVYVE